MERNESDKASNPEFGELLGVENLSGLNIEAAFDFIGKIIDLSDIHGRPEGTQRALELCDELAERSLDDGKMAVLHYFRANAWASHRKRKHKDIKAAWAVYRGHRVLEPRLGHHSPLWHGSGQPRLWLYVLCPHPV